MIRIYYRSVREKNALVIDQFKIGSFVYLESPSEEELLTISEKLGFNMEFLQDALDDYEVPRLEVENNSIYFYGRFPSEVDKTISTTPFLISLNDNFILLIANREVPFIDDILRDENFYTTQRTKCFFQIFSKINLIYSRVLININKRVRKFIVAPEKILNKDIKQFVFFETILNDFLSALISMDNAFNQLLQNKILKPYDQDRELIENLIRANNQLIELAKSNLRNIVNIREAYSTILSNDLNQVIKIFTALTVVLNLPVIFASFYGMNVKLPFENYPHTFYWIVILNLLIVLVVILVFIRKKWL